VIRVFREATAVLEYDAELIEEALLSKHSQTAFLSLKRDTRDGAEACSVVGAQFCKWPSVIRFIRLVISGDVFFDFTLSEDGCGRIKDHGFLWRIQSSAIGRLYLSSKALDLIGGSGRAR